MLLDLPTELVIQILTYLSKAELTSCRLTCRNVYRIIEGSVDLQYHIALLAASATDNPCSPLPLSAKLQQLKNGDKAWAVLKPNFTTTIPVKHHTSGIYDLTGGVYLLGDSNRKDLHYVRLPSRPEDQPEWSTIQVGRTIIDMGLCVYEHDLIAVVTTTPVPGPTPTYDIELILFEFSTSKPHPQANKHVIHVLNTPFQKPAIGIEIVGDNLVLILYYHRLNSKPDDKIFVFDWRTGIIKMSFAVPNETYTGLLFLDEHTIMLPNQHTNSLDIFHIPPGPTLNTSPIISLLLPRLSEGRTVGSISCRAEPNPIGASSSIRKKKEARERAAAGGEASQEEDMFPKRGYLANSEEAICIFALRVHSVQLGQFPFGHTFTFILQRSALLDAMHTHLAKPLANDNAEPTPVFPGFSEPVLQPCPRVPWADWGPGVTRWFNSDSIPTRWITTTAGQRCVLIADSAPDTGFPYVVLDFNPESVSRMRGWLRARKEREKAREIRERRGERARAIEEARQWVETTGAMVQGDEDEDDGDTDDANVEDMLYEPLHEGEDEPAEYHMGADDDVPDRPPGEEPGSLAAWQYGEHAGTSASMPDAVPSTSPLAGPSNGPNVATEGLYSISSPPNGEGDSLQPAEVSEDSTSGVTRQGSLPNDVASTSGTHAHEAAHGEDIVMDEDLNPDLDNPLEGPDPTAARRIWCVTTPEMIEPADTFSEHVEGRLAYVACASARTYPFHGVLLDEERVLGIRTDALDRIRQIEVHHFG